MLMTGVRPDFMAVKLTVLMIAIMQNPIKMSISLSSVLSGVFTSGITPVKPMAANIFSAKLNRVHAVFSKQSKAALYFRVYSSNCPGVSCRPRSTHTTRVAVIIERNIVWAYCSSS